MVVAGLQRRTLGNILGSKTSSLWIDLCSSFHHCLVKDSCNCDEKSDFHDHMTLNKALRVPNYTNLHSQGAELRSMIYHIMHKVR